ncbi:MAG: DNA translocase FtsK 4TM domain-containing protein, partial [Bryobacter sp.]|nr:DNA translocase FtsK 4TM domain-containing protein [Bryobacter sp.]
MKLLGPSPYPRLNEAVALFLLSGGVLLTLSLVSYQPQDPSWNTVAPAVLRPQNLTGFIGSYISDACFQALGLASIALPVFVVLLAWKWMRSQPIGEPLFRVIGAALFLFSACTALSIAPGWRTFSGSIPAGGLVGLLLADFLVSVLNFTGASVMTATLLLLSLYLVSSFSMATMVAALMLPVRATVAAWRRLSAFRLPSLPRFSFRSAAKEKKPKRERMERASLPDPPSTYPENADAPPWDNDPPIVENSQRLVAAPPAPVVEDIPSRTLDELPPPPSDSSSPEPPISELPPPARKKEKAVKKQPAAFQLPPTELLNEPAGRSAYDSQELKDTAARIKAKFEEFNVLG